jgi:DTW domain-containing protein YfiP
MNLPASRPTCARCRRPKSVCYCAHLPQLPTRTRVLILQHPREREVGVGTAWMAHLALPNSILRVGIDFSVDPVVASTLAGDTPYLLFPGPEALDVRELLPEGSQRTPITLVVVDGTWSQARTLVRANPQLAALPRIAFTPRKPSDYRIRREPADFCVSTIEALTEVLSVLEPRGGRFDPLLEPFRAMVNRQEWFATEIRSCRHYKRERPHRRQQKSLGERLATDWSRLVCIHGEANGWPVGDPARQDPELVHFVACRPATGEIYEAVIAPRRPLAPKTPEHIELTAERLLAGCGVEPWRRSWRAFSRADDLMVQWGGFAARLAIDDGVLSSSRRMDLRGELSQSVRNPGATLEDCAARLRISATPLGLDGRAGRRLSAMVAILKASRAEVIKPV